tara:strand:- start:3005 stop:3388 length:384 start_codon:yes stop_codon:yes gene_type:complete
MGDRRVAEIKTEDGSLFFYTHYTGFRMYHDALNALDTASFRRGQSDYALKIVLDYMIAAASARDSETGAGISLSLKDMAVDDYSHQITGGYLSNEPTVLIDIRSDVWEVYDLLSVADRADLGLYRLA